MIKIAVARRYAKALFELSDAATAEPMRHALSALAAALDESQQLRHALASPAVAEQDKIAVVAALAQRVGCPPAGQPFFAQLIRKGRIAFLPEISAAFARLVDESKGTEQVTVSAASALPPEEQHRIESSLRRLLNREVDVTFHTDPKYVAGLHIRIGSTVVDSTVRGRLAAMHTMLTKE